MSSTGTVSIGTLIGARYRVDEVLCGEGSAAVYRATDTRLERPVALRTFAARAGRGAVRREAARLAHPNLARVLDVGVDAARETAFAAAELGAGGSLAALLAQRGAPPLPLALRMVQEAAAGMAAAHRAGVVHGDLHPGMLWLSRDEGRLRVQVLGLGVNPAGSPPVHATASYAAPERLRREPLSPAADVFALGVVAYEVFAGLPGGWRTLLLSMARGQFADVPFLLDARPDLPGHVIDAVHRALQPLSAHRFPDAGELAARLAVEPAAAPARVAASPAAPAAEAAAPVPAPQPRPILQAPDAEPRPIAPVYAPEVHPVEEIAAPEPVEIASIADREPIEVADLIAAEPVVADADDDAAPVTGIIPMADLPIFAAPEAGRVGMDEPAATLPFFDLPIIAAPEAGAVGMDEAPAAILPVLDLPLIAEAPPAPEAFAAPTAQPRQPSARRAQPLAATTTDLAESLYIPPVLERPAAPEPRPAAPAPASAPVQPEPVTALQPQPPADETVEAPPVQPAAPAIHAIAAAPPAADARVPAVTDDAPIPLPVRRRPGLARLGQPSGNRRGLLAASIAVAVVVGGGVIARTVMAGSGGAPAVVQSSLVPRSLAAVTGGSSARPQQPGTVAQPSADTASAASTALAPEAPRRQEEERRRGEEQRRQQQRQDSLSRVQQAAQPQATPQQVALAAAPRPAASAPAPQTEPPAEAAASPPAAPPAAPARPRVEANRVYVGGEVDQAPRLSNGSQFRSAIHRTYPATLRGTGQWGNAIVSFVVGTDGRVERSSISVDQASHPAFRAAASAAVASARFNPARVDGQPVRAHVSMPVTWSGGGERE